MRSLLFALFVLGPSALPVEPAARVEYVAHAAFIIESDAGTRIALDPYNGHTWLGYFFPEGLSADGVAITHPHYDHDASYYFDQSTPVFREPGRYQIGDIVLEGVAGEHAGAERFRSRGATPFNTVWVVEVGGLRIAHLGDNGSLQEATLERMGKADIVIARATGTYEDIQPTLRRLGASVLILNHYRIPDLANLPPMLKTSEEWLGERGGAVRHDDHVVSYSVDALPEDLEVHVLSHHPAVRVWTPALRDAWHEVERAGGEPERALPRYRKAVELAPGVLKFYWLLAGELDKSGASEEARETLERGLVHAARDDWTDRVRARDLLAKLYVAGGRSDLAAVQYRLIARERQSYAATELENARLFLESMPKDVVDRRDDLR